MSSDKQIDWATSTPEEKVRRRWPDAVDFDRIFRSDDLDGDDDRDPLGRTWDDASQHPSVLDLERRETTAHSDPQEAASRREALVEALEAVKAIRSRYSEGYTSAVTHAITACLRDAESAITRLIEGVKP